MSSSSDTDSLLRPDLNRAWSGSLTSWSENPSSERQCDQSRPITPNPDNQTSNSVDPFDVAIVGGGACGLAVAIQLLERAKQGKKIGSIVIFEKSEEVGTGLAYSSASSGSIVNMHADTMGLCPLNPLQFTEWAQKLSPDLARIPYPTRQQYGVYLTQLKENLMTDCEIHGVQLEIPNEEIVDIKRHGQMLELISAIGNKIRARDVVLALGNFCASSQKQFSDTPAYFKCPWPADKLRVIQPDASVLVMGSRLTAIDVANFLAENGHQGPITFLSRSGRLPKVQGPSSTFQGKYRLHSLAKEIGSGDGSQGALARVMSEMENMVREFTMSDFSELKNPGDSLEMLRTDVEDAERGPIPWQTLINSTKPLTERYWRHFTTEEKKTFLQKYNSLWAIYRHAIPLQNAKKIAALMERGQLRVVKGTKVEWDGVEFLVKLGDQTHRGQFLIEALGQEFDTSQLDTASPLLTNLIASQIVKAHPNGGLQVDFETCKADENLHVIGSMTRGVHFYTTAIDRNADHASRIADSIAGIPFRRPVHIAFFVGSDLFSHLMLGKLVPQLLALGHIPFIFMPSDSVNSSKKKAVPFELQELGFFERTLLQEHVIPFLGSTPQEGASIMTVEQMKVQYGIMVKRVPNINAAAFISKIKLNHIDIGISLRCYQRFKTEIIDYFSGPRVLLNLHPGVLPQYRGVITAIRAMMNDEREFGYSLHNIDEQFDAGDLIDVRTKDLNYEKTMLGNMASIYETGVQMVLDAVEKFARGGNMREGAIPQDPAKSGYYSFPNAGEMAVCEAKGVRLVNGEDLKEFLVVSFAGKGRENELRALVNDAVRLWYEKNTDERKGV